MKSSNTHGDDAPWPRQPSSELTMKIELIQPFINAADAVLAEALQCPTRMGDVTWTRKHTAQGVASMVSIKGDIEADHL